MINELENNIEYLENKIEKLSSNLATSFYKVIKILKRITGTNDKFYESSHSLYVSEKSAQIATELGMSIEDIVEIKIAALLHDIGKINLPEVCIYKFPAEMSNVEYTKYSYHSIIGQQFLMPYEYFDNIGEIIYQHHEKLDGSGFPRNLTREQIHIGAKIIAVVDYYHNMLFKKNRQKRENINSSSQYLSIANYLETTKPVYDSSINYLQKKSNILFDSNIVNIFIKIVEKDRKELSLKSIVRVISNTLIPGYIFADDYYTSYGLKIASKGDTITEDSLITINQFLAQGELPNKVLILK